MCSEPRISDEIRRFGATAVFHDDGNTHRFTVGRATATGAIPIHTVEGAVSARRISVELTSIVHSGAYPSLVPIIGVVQCRVKDILRGGGAGDSIPVSKIDHGVAIFKYWLRVPRRRVL